MLRNKVGTNFRANTVRNRNVLSTVRLGMEVLRHSGYTITREDSLVAATLLTQIYSHMVTFWGNYEGSLSAQHV